MDRALIYLQKIHDAAVAASADGTSDPMEIAKKTATALGLPPQMVTPLLARTLGANMRVRNHRDLATMT
jgi:hydroxyacylglutathione hydrolase